jgi:hypothetical protein
MLAIRAPRMFDGEGFEAGAVTVLVERMRPKPIEPERPFADRAVVADHANQRSAEISADRVMRP